MSSLVEKSPTHSLNLKGKIDQVKYLLDNANKRLQDEAMRHEIFTTKTSASPMTAKKQNGLATLHEGSTELKRTITDIGTIQSVLSCPIFNRIVNVTDSLDKLSHQLSLRPSIGPSDVNIDDNGELILAPPMESSSYYNGPFPNDHTNSPQMMYGLHEFAPENSRLINDNDNGHQRMNVVDEVDHCDKFITNDQQRHEDLSQGVDIAGMQHQQQKQQQQMMNENRFDDTNLIGNDAQATNNQAFCLDQQLQQQQQQSKPVQQVYNSEILMTNGNGRKASASQDNQPANQVVERTRVRSVAAAFESGAINGRPSEERRLYEINNRFAPNQMASNLIQDNCVVQNSDPSPQESSHALSYPAKSYQDVHKLENIKPETVEQRAANLDPTVTYANSNIRKHNNLQESTPEPESLQTQSSEKPNRASPSASAGSTVRLMDESDSGTSSFRSQAKGALYSPLSHKPIKQLDEATVDDSLDQQLIDKLSPEMERIKVTLEKGPEGIGITIAGYTCEHEEISGIFIKGITPGSPADRCGKIKILDQIFAVNGQEILGYSNPEATNLLRRHTGKVVTLELMRYLAESRYLKLQNLLENAAPMSHLKRSDTSDAETNPASGGISKSGRIASVDRVDVAKKILTPSQNLPSTAANSLASTSTNVSRNSQQIESIYKNSSVVQNYEATNGTSMPRSSATNPVAAQRYSSPSNKVIETKQGARNTIDIRSPMCQTTATATYVKKISHENDVFDAPMIDTGRTRHEAPVEFSKGNEPEWERGVEIVELSRDSSSQGLGFTVKEYDNPQDQRQSIIMITSITPGGIADINGKLSLGDLLVFVDDKNLDGASLNEAVRALKETNGQVRLGVLKLKR